MDLELIYRVDGATQRRRHAPGRIRIGRDRGCDVVLDDAEVAPIHAIARFDGNSWALMAAADEAAFVVDGRRLKYLLLPPLLQVVLGSTRLTLLLHGRGRAPLTATKVRSSRLLSDFDTAVAAVRSNHAMAVVGPTPPRTLELLRRAAAAFDDWPDADGVLDRLVEMLHDHLPAARIAVLLGAGPAAALLPRAARWGHGAAGLAFTIGIAVADEAIAERRALLVDAADARAAAGSGTAICAPLISDGRVHGVVWVDGAAGAFDTGDLDVVAMLASLAAAALQRRELQHHLEREQRAHDRLARYHAPAVVEQLLHRAEGSGMQAAEREVTVLFADLVGFTAMFENLPALRAQQLLNAVLAELAAAVTREHGTLDKFLGDAVMAFFGAPLPLPDHALCAVRAALAMQHCITSLRQQAAELAQARLRIGINTGVVAIGDIGAPDRRDYTVVGDTVNVASRLQSAVAEPGQIAIGPLTRQQIGAAFDCRQLPPVQLRGREQPLQPWLVDGAVTAGAP